MSGDMGEKDVRWSGGEGCQVIWERGMSGDLGGCQVTWERGMSGDLGERDVRWYGGEDVR